MLIVLLSLLFLSTGLLAAPDEGEGIQGRLVVPGGVRFRDFRLLLQLHAGEEHRFAYCRSDGTFTLPPLPPGVHVLTISGKGEWYFPPLKIDVSSRAADSIRVAFLDTWKPVRLPLVIKGTPLNHFEVRRPFSLWGLLKSPYGIMIGVMLFGIVVFPMMKIDPEEYRQAQEMWRGGQGSQDRPPQLTQPSRRRD